MDPIRRTLLVFVCAAGLVGAAVVRAQPAGSSNDALALGLSLAEEGRCDAALEVLLPVRGAATEGSAGAGAGTGDASERVAVERAIGECALRQERFELALEALATARTLAPDAPGIELRFAQANYHLGRLDEAEAALARASTQGQAGAPEVLLYAGLVALDRGRLELAIERLEAAVATQSEAIEPVASFQLARARARARDEAGARAGYARVVEDNSGTAWADQAARAIRALDAESALPVWGSAEFGFEADDNALIRGRGVGRPEELSGQSDTRLYWFADVGALFFERDRSRAGAALRYGGSEHRELERFDTHAPGATLWLDRDFSAWNVVARIQYDFDTAWIGAEAIDDDPFVLSHLWSASLFKSWQPGGVTTLVASMSLDDYLYGRATLDVDDVTGGDCPPCSPDGVDEIDATNRDGFGPILGLSHRQGLPEPGFAGLSAPWIEGGYRYQLFASQGSEYDHQRHQIELGAGIRLPLAVDLSIRGRYAYLPYANATIFPDPKDELAAVPYFLDRSDRREHETAVRIALQRAFGEHLLVALRWSRTRNRSTADVFDYDRNLVGISLRVGFGG